MDPNLSFEQFHLWVLLGVIILVCNILLVTNVQSVRNDYGCSQLWIQMVKLI